MVKRWVKNASTKLTHQHQREYVVQLGGGVEELPPLERQAVCNASIGGVLGEIDAAAGV